MNIQESNKIVKDLKNIIETCDLKRRGEKQDTFELKSIDVDVANVIMRDIMKVIRKITSFQLMISNILYVAQHFVIKNTMIFMMKKFKYQI